MSFVCQGCLEAQPPRAKPVLLPVEFRDKEYAGVGELGREIAREARLCTDCADQVKPTVSQVVNREISGQDLEVALTALQWVGRKQLGV